MELLSDQSESSKNHLATVSAEVETSKGIEESQKKNSMAPERENHTRMADLSELKKERMKEAHDGQKAPNLSRTSELAMLGGVI